MLYLKTIFRQISSVLSEEERDRRFNKFNKIQRRAKDASPEKPPRVSARKRKFKEDDHMTVIPTTLPEKANNHFM